MTDRFHKKKSRTYKLRPELIARLEQFCSSRRPRVSRTDVVEYALEEYLDKQEAAPRRRTVK